MQQVYVVEGMSCAHCVKAITRAVQQLDPQAQVQVALAEKKVVVESTAAREAIAQAMAREGYAVAA
ncbi:MAG: heavy-metal-associated domain-containing protein [Limnohabitans sp.]|jgi:copper chaperone